MVENCWNGGHDLWLQVKPSKSDQGWKLFDNLKEWGYTLDSTQLNGECPRWNRVDNKLKTKIQWITLGYGLQILKNC